MTPARHIGIRRASALTGAAVAAGLAGGGWAFGYGPLARAVPAAAPPVRVSTTVVRAGTLAVREDDTGTIGYADPDTVYAVAAGTITFLPAPGAIIRRGQPLYEIDGQDVLLLRGATPAWRAFAPGMTPGADVSELQANLIALSFDPYHAIRVDGVFGWATQAAVERWQTALGSAVTGQLALGQVVFLPGDVQVSGLLSGTGAAVSPGTPVLASTSTTPIVTVTVPVAEQYVIHAGQPVDVTLPDGSVSPGHVVSVSPAPGNATAGASASGGGGQSGASGGQQGASGQEQASVVVAPDRPVTGFDGASVQVAIATAQQSNALIVPISALLAGPAGSYQITVVRGSAAHDVTVTPGLFDDVDGLVAISGPGIGPGTRVEVPST